MAHYATSDKRKITALTYSKEEENIIIIEEGKHGDYIVQIQYKDGKEELIKIRQKKTKKLGASSLIHLGNELYLISNPEKSSLIVYNEETGEELEIGLLGEMERGTLDTH